jgi:ZIP family zinc transporter
MDALEAGFWGFVGGASLLVGALIGLYVSVPQRVIATVMALGAGVLVSSVTFELMDEAYKVGGFDAASVGLLSGAVAFFGADWAVHSTGGKNRKRSGGQQAEGSATAITIGAIMDGIPESVAIGVSLIEGGAVGAVMVVAVFLRNVPEALSAAAGMKKAGHSAAHVLGLWGTVVVCAASALFGYLFLDGASEDLIAAILAFAAGAILTMLASTMFPEAYEEGGHVVGVVTTIGFLLAFLLSRLA